MISSIKVVFTVTSCLHLLRNAFTRHYKFFYTNISTIFRSSYRKCSIKKAILKYFVIFTGKRLWWCLFFNQVAGHQTCNFMKRRLQHRYFLVSFGKFYKNTYFEEHLRTAAFLESFVRTFFRSEISKKKF